MTVKELFEISTNDIYLDDMGARVWLRPGSILVSSIENCVVRTLSSGGDDIEITLKTQLVRE